MTLTCKEIQELEYEIDYRRRNLALAWDRKWCGADRVKTELHALTGTTLELFKAYGDFEPEWREYLFGKLT